LGVKGNNGNIGIIAWEYPGTDYFSQFSEKLKETMVLITWNGFL